MRPVAEVTAEEKRQALDALLASEALARSGRLRSLLRFIGEAEIEGRCAQLNEYVIGVEALARPEGYSPIEDSSVRSRIHELRQRIERFYSTEAPATPVRIELPKGSHCPRFVRSAVSISQAPVRAKFNGHLLWAGAAGLVAGVLASWLVLMIRQDRHEAADAATWTPALDAIWQPLLDGNAPILISYEARLFLATGTSGIIRDFTVNGMDKIESSLMLMKVKKALDLPELYENRNYTEFGYIQAGILLTRLLGTRKSNISAKRSSDLTWNDLRSDNVILLGKPATDPQVQHFLTRTEFIDEASKGIRVVHPKPGERSLYLEDSPKDPLSWTEKYAVVSFGPGAERGRFVMCLAASGAEHPWAVASYLTNPAHAKELVGHLHLRSGKMPAAYQVLIRARFRAQEPARVEYVTHRVLSADK